LIPYFYGFSRVFRVVRVPKVYYFKVESLYEEDLDTHPADEPEPWIVHQSFAGDGNVRSACFRDLHPAADQTGFVFAHSDPANFDARRVDHNHARRDGIRLC
jgi:hypothetical protein